MSEKFSQDQNRKTLRSFYCRDYLWEMFEQMTRELGCSMDYLINESMRQYARSRDYTPQDGEERDPAASGNPPKPNPQGGQQGQPPNPNQMQGGQNPDMEHRTFEQVPSVGGNQPNQSQGSQGQSGPPPSPNQGPGPSGSGGPPPPPSPNQQQGGQEQGWQQQQNPQPGGGGGQAGPQQNRQTLYLLFNNNRYPIESDRFVIGRGSQNTDLTIRDGNISRQHCAIIYRNNNWYMKDLDSTNGVDYRGNRIESKRIEEGDVFYLCDYPLQFTYR